MPRFGALLVQAGNAPQGPSGLPGDHLDLLPAGICMASRGCQRAGLPLGGCPR